MSSPYPDIVRTQLLGIGVVVAVQTLAVWVVRSTKPVDPYIIWALRISIPITWIFIAIFLAGKTARNNPGVARIITISVFPILFALSLGTMLHFFHL